MLLIYYVISLYNSIMKSTYMCFLKDLNENRPRLALILRLTAIVGVDIMICSTLITQDFLMIFNYYLYKDIT